MGPVERQPDASVSSGLVETLPTEWFEIGDGWVGVSSSNEAFVSRFGTVFAGCRRQHSKDDRPAVFLTVEPTSDGWAEAVFEFRNVENPVDVTRLLADQGFPETRPGGFFGHRYRPAGWTRPLEGATDRMGFHLDDAWPWLVAHVAVYAVLTAQQHLMCFHGAAMSIHGKGLILLGPSGAGKTTLAVSLARRGHSYLSDEIAAVEIDSRLLVPVRRSALVREEDGAANGRTIIGELSGGESGCGTRLNYVVCLRRFCDETKLERFWPSMSDLRYITPLSCSLTDGGSSIIKVLTLINSAECYYLDSADPVSAADLLERLGED